MTAFLADGKCSTLGGSAGRPGRAHPSNWLAQTKLKPVERIQITFEDAGSGLLRFRAKMTALEVIEAAQVWRSGRDLYDSTHCCTVVLRSRGCLSPRCLANEWAFAQQCQDPETNHGPQLIDLTNLNSLHPCCKQLCLQSCLWPHLLLLLTRLPRWTPHLNLSDGHWMVNSAGLGPLVTVPCWGQHCPCWDHPQLPACPPSWSSPTLTAPEQALKYRVSSPHMKTPIAANSCRHPKCFAYPASPTFPALASAQLSYEQGSRAWGFSLQVKSRQLAFKSTLKTYGCSPDEERFRFQASQLNTPPKGLKKGIRWKLGFTCRYNQVKNNMLCHGKVYVIYKLKKTNQNQNTIKSFIYTYP